MRGSAAVLLSCVALAGCPKGSLPDLSGLKPKVKFERVRLDGIDFTKADTTFVFTVTNPNPVGIRVASFDYDLDVAGAGFLEGTNNDGLAIAASDDSKFRLPVTVVFADLLRLAQNLGDVDEVPFRIAGSFGIDTPLGVVRIPYEENGNLPVVRPPRIRVAGLRVTDFKPLQNRASLSLDLGVTHKGGAAVPLTGFNYSLSLGGSRVADGSRPQLATVAAGAEQTVSLPIDVNLTGLGTSIVSAIANKGPVDVGLAGGLTVGTPFGELPLRIDENGRIDLR
jgi:LEA14-like dessication related protein